jgi:hypothetical protein
MKFLQLILENIFRNPVRTALTALGTIVLVMVVTLVWSVLEFLQNVTTEKTSNIKGSSPSAGGFPRETGFSGPSGSRPLPKTEQY